MAQRVRSRQEGDKGGKRRSFDVVCHLLEDFSPVRYAPSSVLAYTAFRNSVTYIGLV